jgi:hypothetical protein
LESVRKLSRKTSISRGCFMSKRESCFVATEMRTRHPKGR